MKNKVIAKQIAPEFQESPLYTFDEWPENVYVFGNRYYTGHGAETIENIKSAMYDAADDLKFLMRGKLDCSFIDIINDILPAPEHKNEYSRADRLEWRRLLLAYDAGAIDDDDATTAALLLITGQEYASAEIRGCCQGDWQNVIYPAAYGREWLEVFETEYFNTGSEWIIDDDFSIYTYSWNSDGIREEIAGAVGADPADVVLLEFTGWNRTAVYTEVTA